MARRTSSRAASHDQASSPPKASRQPAPSPSKRSTRSTRSQSRDLDEPFAPARKSATRRNERQGSIDSVASDASMKNNGRGKKARSIAPVQPELSMVAEAEEREVSPDHEGESQELPRLRQPPGSIPSLGMPQLSEPSEQPAQSATGRKIALLPAAQIHSASTGRSFYRGKGNVRFFVARKDKANVAPPSNQQQLQGQADAGPSTPKTPQNKATRKQPWSAPANTSQDVHTVSGDPSTDQMVALLGKVEAETNKENRPLPTETDSRALPATPQRKSFTDRQDGAHRVSQIGDSDSDSQPQPTTRQPTKRARQESEELTGNDAAAAVDEDDFSEDGGFDPPPETIQIGRERKRAKLPVVLHNREADIKPRQPRINATVSRWERHASANRVQERVDPVSSNAAGDVVDMSQAADIHRVVRETAQRQSQVYRLTAGAQRATQTRVKWTDEEQSGFLDLIMRYGCSWAYLLGRGQDEGIFHESRNQVSLKDKARNMKVEFLIAKAPLPENFDHIALGRKEREKVISRGENPYRREGERVGQEMLDINGNVRDVFE